MKKLVLIVVLIGFALSLSGGLVFAGIFDGVSVIPGDVTTGNELLQKIETITNWVFTVFLVLAVFGVLMAAFQFVTGGPEGVSEARQKLIWAAVGIAIAVFAKAIPTVIVNILGVGSPVL